jgi:hypothetical protein
MAFGRACLTMFGRIHAATVAAHVFGAWASHLPNSVNIYARASMNKG